MLTGEKILLRPWRATDLEFFAALRNDIPTQSALLALPRPNPTRRVQDWLDQRSAAEDGLFFVIAEREGDRPCGFLELRGVKPVHGWGSLGICLDATARGRGYAREAVEMLEAYARRVFGLRKIVLEVSSENSSAIGLYEAAGYARVGVHRQHFFHDGRFQDVLIMEKLLS